MKTRCVVGVDAGGTFTDFVALTPDGLRSAKLLSTPEDPSRAVLEGIKALGLGSAPALLIHGTTVGTNAVLEGKGVKVVFVTNKGFKDLLAVGRQNRREIYDLCPLPEAPPIAEADCLEAATRTDSEGNIVEPLTAEDIAQLVDAVDARRPEAVAINLLFSFSNPTTEEQLHAALSDRYFVSSSHRVLPVIREYERGIATWLNAYVGPLMDKYLKRLTEHLPGTPVSVLQSAGTTIGAELAADDAVRLLLSGPAGGLAAAEMIGRQRQSCRLMTLDMGGTSTDVALIDGGVQLTDSATIAGYPLAVPMVDMHTIGAGGGSIARVDSGGMLQVGPDSAGAEPGPVCYGLGGEQPTVTDAHLVLGRIPAGAQLAGSVALDYQAAYRALSALGQVIGVDALAAAKGVIRVANQHMVRALRVISVEKGHDPRDFQLFSFGGAGGLHVCELAQELGIRQAVVPKYGGVLSALGMLASRPGRVLNHAVLRTLDELDSTTLDGLFDALADRGRAAMESESLGSEKWRIRKEAVLRYRGQSSGLVIAYRGLAQLEQRFHQRYADRYGYRLDSPVELAELRVKITAAPALPGLPSERRQEVSEGQYRRFDELGMEVPVYRRRQLASDKTYRGPLIVAEPTTTTYVAPQWCVKPDAQGHLILTLSG